MRAGTDGVESAGMARRSTPERLDAAREAGFRRYLEDAVGTGQADRLIARWRDEAQLQRLPRDEHYWDRAHAWLNERGELDGRG
jgi:hypothetical protein